MQKLKKGLSLETGENTPEAQVQTQIKNTLWSIEAAQSITPTHTHTHTTSLKIPFCSLLAHEVERHLLCSALYSNTSCFLLTHCSKQTTESGALEAKPEFEGN